jgi:predicted RND superfamily exporter protein
MTRFISNLLRWRVSVLVIVALITVASVLLVVERAVIGNSLGELFLGEDPNYPTYREDIRTFISDEVIIVALENVDALDPDTLTRLENAILTIKAIDEPCPSDAPSPAAKPTIATDDFEEDDDETQEASFAPGRCPLIKRVDSVLSAQQIQMVIDEFGERTLVVRSFADEARTNPDQKAELLRALRADQWAGEGALISNNGQHIAVVFEIMPSEHRSAEFGPVLLDDIEAALADAGFPVEEQHVVGFIAILSEALDTTNHTLETIFPFCALVLLIVVYLMFRRMWPVLLSVGVSLIAVAWTLGFSVLIDPKISIMHSMVPAVVLIVGFSDVIHLCSAYLIELGRTETKGEALIASCMDVGQACIYTSLTTFVGFLGLSFIPTPMFRLLGVILGFGVGIALLLAITLVPIAFSMMRTPKPWRVGITGHVQQRVDVVMNWVKCITMTRPWLVIGVSVGVLAFSAYGISQLQIEAALTDNFDKESRVQRDADFFNEHFVAANVVNIFLETDQNKGLLDPALVARIHSLQRKAESLGNVERVRSYVDLLAVIHDELTKGLDDTNTLPTTRNQIAEYMLLFEDKGGEGIDRLLDVDRKKALVSVRVTKEGARASRITGDEVSALLQDGVDDAIQVRATGVIYLLGGWLDEIIAGQARGLGVIFLIIALMMAIGLRSVRIGLLSMIPNALPLLVLGGVLGVTYDEVDSDTLFLAMLAIGVGVDDTIHFLMRFRIESERSANQILALERTFEFAGRAIVMTTVTLALGFAPFALSGYFSIWILGVYLPLTLVVALLADLFLIPAMAQVGLIRFRPPTANPRDETPSPDVRATR